MGFVAVIGLIINLICIYILFSERKHSLNIRSVVFHLLGDTLSSVGVIGGAVIIYWTDNVLIDAVIGILIGSMVIRWAYLLLVESVHILLEATPVDINSDEIVNRLMREVNGIINIHDLHIWELTSDVRMMTAHVVIDDMPVSRSMAIIDEITGILRENYGIHHTNIQIECSEGGCSHQTDDEDQIKM